MISFAVLVLALALLPVLLLTAYVARARYNQARIRRTFGIKGATVSLRTWWTYYLKRSSLLAALFLAPLAAFGVPLAPGFWKAANTANKVFVGPAPETWYAVPLKVKTATNLRSGRVVKKDTDDDSIQVLGSAEKNGLALMGTENLTNPAWDHTTAPAVDDVVICYILAPGQAYKFRNGANLAQGDQAQWGGTALAALASAAAGDTAKRICRVTESADGSGAQGNITGVVC